jgi:hypothetical protein
MNILGRWLMVASVMSRCTSDSSAADAGDAGEHDAGGCDGSAPLCYGSCNVDDTRYGECVNGAWQGCVNECPCINNQGPPDLCYVCADGGLGPQQLCDTMTDTFYCPDGSAEMLGACSIGDASSD